MNGHKQTPQERCGYCGRFMRTKDFDGWDTEPYCTRTEDHILADPEHWSIDVENVVLDDGVPYTGHIGAHHLTNEQLRTALGLPTEGAS